MTADEIAAEAADKISNALNSKVAVARKAQLIAIIKSAIEKAETSASTDDTKRLDWLERTCHIVHIAKELAPMATDSLREAIDAAIERKRSEKI